MGTSRCLTCCTKALFAATLIFAAATLAFASVLVHTHYDHRLLACSSSNTTCSSWLEEVHPRHILIIDGLMPTIFGSGLVLVAAAVSLLGSSQEDRALTLHLTALPFVSLAAGYVSKALQSSESNKADTDRYMSFHHLLYCGALYITAFMLIISMIILSLKQRQTFNKNDYAAPQSVTSLRRAASCEVIRTRDPSNSRSPVLIAKHQVLSASAPVSAASTRPGSRIALLSNQAGMSTSRVPATSMESVLYCVRESNDEHVSRDIAGRRKGSFSLSQQPTPTPRCTSSTGPSDDLPSSAALPAAGSASSSGSDSAGAVTNIAMFKMQKTSRRSYPPPAAAPGTPAESAW